MFKRRLSAVTASAMLLSTLAGIAPTAASAAKPSEDSLLPYWNASLSVNERVADLLGRMTLDEKIGQMVQAERASVTQEDVKTYALGSVLSGGGSFPNGQQADSTRANWAEMVDSYQSGALSTRLGIPILYGVDAVHGQSNLIGATLFPHNIGLGATRDPALVTKIGAATAEEVKASGTNWAFAPTMADPQNINWGRTYEGFGDNQDLVAQMGAAYIKGLQGTSLQQLSKTDKVVATAKHFLGEGLTDNGTNQGNVSQMTEQQVLDLDLKIYKSAVDAGARTVMASYNSIQGLKMHANQRLLTDVLKGQLGFDGFVISDYNGVHQITQDWNGNPVSGLKDQIKVAVNAGIDMLMEPTDWKTAITDLKELAQSGDIPQSRIDDAVTRILRVKFESGVFEHPMTDTSLANTFGSDAHRALARQAVAESLVLLKNDNVNGSPILSQLKNMDKIFIAGKSADDIGLQSGGWSITWQGQAGNVTPGTTILQGIKNAVGSSKSVTYNKHGRGAEGSDVAIAIVGETPYAESNGDSLNQLQLDKEDQLTLDNLKASGVPTIVILVSGRPLMISDRLNDWAGLVEAWLPGTEGEGVADVLFGNADFKGKLPIRWPFFADAYTTPEAGQSNLESQYILFDYGYGLTKKQATPTLKPVPEEPGQSGYDKVEVENYTAQSGLQAENTSDSGGGQDMGYADKDDWATYNINVPASGTFDVDFRYAVGADASTGVEILNDKEEVLGKLTVGNTGGWQNWQTATVQGVKLEAGTQTIKLRYWGGSLNLNWFGSLGFSPAPKQSGGNGGTVEPQPVIAAGAVENWVSNERDTQDQAWYYAPQWQDGDKQLEQQPNLDLTQVGTSDTATTITIDPNKEYQSMIGMGTSMEDSTVYNLVRMSPEKQDELLKKLASPTEGIGMSLFRLTIGTADFTAHDFYTYDDMPAGQTDPTLSRFSIQKDIDYGIIGTVKKIQAINPNVKFFASPWSPPGWMKTTDSMIRGQVKEENMDVLAEYYLKYVQAYADQGIRISALTLQNEPLLEIDYPSTKLPWQQEAELAKLLRKKLNDAGFNDVLIWIFDHNPSDTMNYPAPLLSDSDNRAAVDGTAFHDYGGDLGMMTQLHNLYPDENIYLTERAVWGTAGADRIAQYFRNWARSYDSWVAMLDSDIQTHHWTGTPDPTLLVQDSADRDNYWITPEYYLLGQFSKFVEPGYTRIDSNYGSKDTVTNVAFLSPDKKTIVTVVINQTDASQTFKLVSDGTQIAATIPAKSVATYRWNRVESDGGENPPTVQALPGFLQAEAYSAASDGVQVIAAPGPDADANTTVLAPAGSTLSYQVNAPVEGDYNVTYLYAAAKSDAAVDRPDEAADDSSIEVPEEVPVDPADNAMDNATEDAAINAAGNPADDAVNISADDATDDAAVEPADDVPSDVEGNVDDNAAGDVEGPADDTADIPADDAADVIPDDVPVDAADASSIDNSDNVQPSLEWTSADDQSLGSAVLSGSSDASDWVSVTGTVHLSAGLQTVQLHVKDSAAQLNWIAIGPTLLANDIPIAEGQEDGSTVDFTLLNGTFVPELTAGNWKLEGLPGVSIDQVMRAGDNSVSVRLSGHSAADIDADRSVSVTASAKESVAGSVYGESAMRATLLYHAANDPESISVSPIALDYGVDGKQIDITLTGGTFVEDHIGDISVSGPAGISVLSATYTDAHTASIKLGWNNSPYYGSVPLQVSVPPSAYGDSSGDGSLEATVDLSGGPDHHPEAISIPGTVNADDYNRLSGAMPSGGNLTGFGPGSWADFNINIPSAGTYTMTAKVTSPNGGGFLVKNGNGDTLGTFSIPSLSNSTTVGARLSIDLPEGKQTLRIQGTGSFSLSQIDIERNAAQPVAADGPTKIEAESYLQAGQNVIQYGSPTNLGYTVAGTTMDYSLDVAKAGYYQVTYHYATSQGSVTAALQANGMTLSSTSLPSTGDWGKYMDASSVVHLEQGAQTIRIVDNGDGFNLDWFQLEPTDASALPKEQAAVPVISVSGQKASLTTTTDGASIHYTTDGTLPTKDSPVYTGEIQLSSKMVIRAIVIKDGWMDSYVGFYSTMGPKDSGNDNGNGNGNGNGNTGNDGGTNAGSGTQQPAVVQAPAPVVDPATGRAVATIGTTELNAALAQAQPSTQGVRTVQIDVPVLEGQSAYQLVLPAANLSASELTAKLEIQTGIGTVVVPSNMVPAADLNGNAQVSLTIGAADITGLDSHMQAQIGSRPVIELGLLAGGTPVSWSNPSSPVMVRIPYTPTAAEMENPSHIAVWYIDGQGRAVSVPNGRYDEKTGTVTFTTTHFSSYAVVFVNKTFSDLTGFDWAQGAIENLAAKGIVNGTSDSAYSPKSNVKRADFIVMLVRALGLSAKPDGNFDDVESSAYYADALAIAKQLGIVKGDGHNRFDPEAAITRQEMMTLAARALTAVDMDLPAGSASDLSSYADSGSIASYAANSVATLVKNGIVNGSGGRILPLGTATRAETAVIVDRIFNLQ